ncbi:hypothetical protein BAL199_14337 [alpha proteobacterium BAL199]|jgi:hypothetical protein|nr:hypothetical protein BAL199_14337 [alpha proteobacterium BAL199]
MADFLTMSRFTASVAAILLVCASTTGALAQSDGQKPPSPTERLQEGAAAIVDGLRMLMDQLQSYQPPEVMPNGDIIIRRHSPTQDDTSPPKPEKTEPDAPKPLTL